MPPITRATISVDCVVSVEEHLYPQRHYGGLPNCTMVGTMDILSAVYHAQSFSNKQRGQGIVVLRRAVGHPTVIDRVSRPGSHWPVGMMLCESTALGYDAVYSFRSGSARMVDLTPGVVNWLIGYLSENRGLMRATVWLFRPWKSFYPKPVNSIKPPEMASV